MRSRWLPEFPNYRTASSVRERPRAVSKEQFWLGCVSTHVPCVIRGCAADWPAVRRWSLERLRRHADASPDVTVNVSLSPLPEEIGVPLTPRTQRLSLSSFFALIEGGNHPFVQAYYAALTNLGSLAGDVGGFAFLDIENHPARTSADRLFLSKAGYTDWHVHPADETLTVQIRGSKEILLLGPDASTHRALLPAAKYGAWRYPRNRWTKEYSGLMPWRVMLEPGDVLYIPMNWWHVAEALDDGFNVTLARVFATPLEWQCDLRLPNVRRSLRLTLATGALTALRSRSLAPALQAARMLLVTAAGFPVSLAKHGAVDWSV